MKRKLFSLLLATVALSIFQTNAETEPKSFWIFADTSGLAPNASETEKDSFPNKKLGLHNWFSVKDSSKVYVHPATADRLDFYRDVNNTFKVKPSSLFPDQFTITATNGNIKLEIQEQSTFQIVQFDENKRTAKQFGEDSIVEGYLAPAQNGTLNAYDSALFLTGVDNEGNISFKKFSQFAAHADSLPANPCLSYQFTNDTVLGRLYQSDTYPFFQIYHGDSALVSQGGSLINWSERKKDNPTTETNEFIYTYYDFKYVKDSNSISTNNKTVSLETIVDYVRDSVGKHGFIIKEDSLSGIDTATVDVKNDSLLYLRVDSASWVITFTALAADGINWTNGTPTTLKYKEQDVWYYLDATDTTKAFFALAEVLISLFDFERAHFNPDSNQIERYIYKDVNDDWRPLYIKALPAQTDSDPLANPYEYVKEEWLEEDDFNLTAATQRIVIGKEEDYYYISEDADVVSGDANAAPRFTFEWAARIGSNDSIAGVDQKFAGANIDLFHIKHGNLYLTVLDTTEFPSLSGSTSTVANTKLNWENKINTDTADTLRQAFAILKKDSVFTFLPVASRKHANATYSGELQYNTGIGTKSKDKFGNELFADITKVWHIAYKASEELVPVQKLVVADTTSDNSKFIWLELEAVPSYWGGPGLEDGKFAVIYKNDSTHYSASGIFANKAGVSLEDSIRSHWSITYVVAEEEEVTAAKKRWVFTPRIETIYGVAQNKVLTDTFLALNLSLPEGDFIELIKSERSEPRDTIKVELVAADAYRLPFKQFESDSLKVAILASSAPEYNLSNKDGNAVLRPVTASDTFKVTLRKSNEQTLADGLHIPYYVFSFKDSLFLKADGDVQWVELDSTQIDSLFTPDDWHKNYAPFKFSLPYENGVEGENVYLQTLDSEQKDKYGLLVSGSVLFSINTLKFEEALKDAHKYASEEGIYSALDQYKGNLKPAVSWKIVLVADDAEEPDPGTGIQAIGAVAAKIYGTAGGVKVVNASGSVSVYTIDGRLVTTQAIASPNHTIAVPAGIYIVKSGANAVKVVVK